MVAVQKFLKYVPGGGSSKIPDIPENCHSREYKGALPLQPTPPESKDLGTSTTVNTISEYLVGVLHYSFVVSHCLV